MPPKKSQQAQSLARARAVEILAEKNATLSSEMAAENLWHQLHTANSRITELKEMLALKEVECNELRSNLDKCKQEIIEYKASASSWESKQKATYHDLQMQRQITKRGQTKQAKLQQKIEILQKAEAEASSFYLEGSKLANQNITLLQNSNTKLHHQLSNTMDRCAKKLSLNWPSHTQFSRPCEKRLQHFVKLPSTPKTQKTMHWQYYRRRFPTSGQDII